VMPMIESTYKVSKKADDRAIAGLSMGGGQTVNVAFNKPELFRYVGLMSPAVNAGMEAQYAVFKDAAKLNQQFKVFWMSVGKDDTLVGAGDKAFEEALTKNNIKHTFKYVDGRHEWTVWRYHLNELATVLFK